MRGRRVSSGILIASLTVGVCAATATAGSSVKWHVTASAKRGIAQAYAAKHHLKSAPRVEKSVAVRTGNVFHALAWLAQAKGQPEMLVGERATASAAIAWTDRGESKGKPCQFGSDAVVKLLGYGSACGLTSSGSGGGSGGGGTPTPPAATTIVSATSFPPNPDLVHPVQWADDGTHIVWIDGSYDIESVPAAGGSVATLTSTNSNGSIRNSFAVSPDGSKIAYDYFVTSPCCSTGVRTIASDGSGSPVATYGPPSPMTAGDGVAWSSDSADVYFSNYDSGNGESWIAEVASGGGTPTEVTAPETQTLTWDIPLMAGSNGNLLFDHQTSSGNDDELRLANGTIQDTGSIAAILSPDGTQLLTVSPRSEESFSPDGSKLAYSDYSGTWMANADGSSPKRVSTTQCQSPIAWSPDDSKLACAIGSSAIGVIPTS